MFPTITADRLRLRHVRATGTTTHFAALQAIATRKIPRVDNLNAPEWFETVTKVCQIQLISRADRNELWDRMELWRKEVLMINLVDTAAMLLCLVAGYGANWSP